MVGLIEQVHKHTILSHGVGNHILHEAGPQGGPAAGVGCDGGILTAAHLQAVRCRVLLQVQIWCCLCVRRQEVWPQHCGTAQLQAVHVCDLMGGWAAWLDDGKRGWQPKL